MTAWLVIAAGEDRQHGGNDGYDDEPSAYYSWDSTVGNAERVAPGDRIVLWDKKTLIGASIIEEIEQGYSAKPVYRCASCGRSGIKLRKTKRPLYRCHDCKAEFDVPAVEVVEVTTYRSRHDAGWVDLYGALSGRTLRSLCESSKSQQSIRRLEWSRFIAALGRSAEPISLSHLELREHRVAGGHRDATVRVRVGQGAFRSRVLATYGDLCAISGPCPRSALEAAHLYSYAELGAHHPDGGLPLRSDIHVLFDEGLIAVDPALGRVDVDESIRRFRPYGQLHGASLYVELGDGLRGWLAQHWHQHRSHD